MKLIHKTVFIFAILAFIVNILYVWQSPAMRASWMGNDEYFFYRVTMNLPDLETTGVWLIDEKAPNPEGVDDAAVYRFDRAYTTPIWIHPVISNYIAYPIAMLFDDVAEQIQVLRLIDIAIIIITVVLFLDVIRIKTNPYIATISILPLMVGRLLLANAIMFYHDLFMWLFFALTMWIITRKPNSRWIILLSTITVLCKINALILIVPILLYLNYQNKNKIFIAQVGLVSVVAFVGYLVFQAIVAGDPLYVLHHWRALNPQSKLNITKNVLPYLWSYVLSWGLWVSMPLIVVGIFLTIKRRIKAFYGFASFGVVTFLFAGWGFYAYQVFPVMYSAMFMIPVIWFSSYISKSERQYNSNFVAGSKFELVGVKNVESKKEA